ncbi:unnamed protein product, partial [Pleuronectes platessa]
YFVLSPLLSFFFFSISSPSPLIFFLSSQSPLLSSHFPLPLCPHLLISSPSPLAFPLLLPLHLSFPLLLPLHLHLSSSPQLTSFLSISSSSPSPSPIISSALLGSPPSSPSPPYLLSISPHCLSYPLLSSFLSISLSLSFHLSISIFPPLPSSPPSSPSPIHLLLHLPSSPRLSSPPSSPSPLHLPLHLLFIFLSISPHFLSISSHICDSSLDDTHACERVCTLVRVVPLSAVLYEAVISKTQAAGDQGYTGREPGKHGVSTRPGVSGSKRGRSGAPQGEADEPSPCIMNEGGSQPVLDRSEVLFLQCSRQSEGAGKYTPETH